MPKKICKKIDSTKYDTLGIIPSEDEWNNVVTEDGEQTITGTKSFNVANANVFATGTGTGNYFQCRKFRGEGNANTYYHALDFGYSGHNQWDFYEYGGQYNFYLNTSADGSGKVALFQISSGAVTSYKPLNANDAFTAKGAFTSTKSTTLSHIKSAGILGTDDSGKIVDNSSLYQKAGDYATKSDLEKYQPRGDYQVKGDYVTYDKATKDVYLGSYGIYSGARPSSGSAQMAGNGYWLKEGSVEVSSAVSGGGARSSEMTPDYISVGNGAIKLNTGGIVSDSGTFTFNGNPGKVATDYDLKDYVTIGTAQTITGTKTFNAPANVNGQEVATATFKTSNGGQLIIGKEGPNSGTMLRFDQVAGTNRLRFRASATPGAMVWSQPENGAALYFDLTDSKGTVQRSTLSARNGEIARTSDIGNGTITIQKNGAKVDAFSTNQSSAQTINIPLSKGDVGLGNVDNTADSAKSVKYATSAGSATDATNATTLVSTDKKTKYTTTDITSIKNDLSNKASKAHTHEITDVKDLDTTLEGINANIRAKMYTEFHDLSYGIFFRDSGGSQYTGINEGGNERRRIVAFDNTTAPLSTKSDIGYKMVDLCTVMSAGVDASDSKNFGGAIFANAIGPNHSSGQDSDLLLAASKEASNKFKETYGSKLDGGLGCLDGVAKGSLFKSKINSSAGKIYTSALMFKPNADSNDTDFNASSSIITYQMPCFSIYEGIQVTTSGSIYNRSDVIGQLRDKNQYNVAFLAYSKTGKNVDMDRIASSISAASKKPTIGKSEFVTISVGATEKITHTANQDIIYEGYSTYQGNGNYPIDVLLQRISDTETSIISGWSSEQGSTSCTVDVHFHRVTY